MRKIIAGLLLALGITAAAAQAPPPVPALPDTARLTTYSISATTCICAVGFQLYGDSTDVGNWIQVWVNGAQMAQAGNWTITSPTGSLATIPRPITDAVLTFTAAQTGTIQIVGARRPRRLSQFSENRGVAARDLNQAVTDLVAENREQWDALLRTMMAPPGDTAPSMILPSVAARASKFLGFDATGVPAVFTPGIGSGGNVVGSGSSTNGNVVCYNGTTGLAVLDCGVGIPIPLTKGGTSQITAPLARGSAGLNIDQYTPIGNTNYTILATDRTVGTNAAFTAPRIWTLPAANAVNPGQAIDVADYFGSVTGTNTLTVQRAGADTISISPASTTSVVLNVAFGRIQLRSDGVSKWSTAATTSASSLPWRSPMDYGALCDNSTDDRTAIQAWLNGISGTYIGYVPPGKICTYSQFVFVASNTTIYGYGATMKARNSANASTGFLLTDNPGGGLLPGPSNVAIYGLKFDGNKVNRTGPFSYANIYMTGATNVTIQDVVSINCTQDCFYVGGNVTTTGVSTNVQMMNITGTNSGRNGLSIVGVQNLRVVGCQMTGAISASPMHGIDIEPDSTNTPDSDFYISHCELSGNGGVGMAINPGAVAGAAVNRGQGHMLSANSNTGCGFQQFVTAATAAGFRLVGISGAANGGGLACTLAVDKVP